MIAVAALIFLGIAHRALDRMRLTDTQAILVLGALFASPFLPNVALAPGIRIDVAGALIPLAIAAYLIITADQRHERMRALAATLVTAAAVFAFEQLLPPEPTQELPVIDVDPVWAAGLIAGVVAYLAGRSRRSAFIAGVAGVTLADIAYGILAAARGTTGALAAIGGGGVFDAIVIAGVLGVALAEIVGETREYFARTRGTPATEEAGARARPDGEGAESRVEETLPGGALTLVVSLLLSAVLLTGSTVLGARMYGQESPPHTLAAGYRIFDENGDLVNQTAWAPSVGDTWIDETNMLFEVVRTEGRMAIARAVGKIQLVEGDQPAETLAATGAADAANGTGDEAKVAEPVTQRAGLIDFLARVFRVEGTKRGERPRVLILHTHNAESYVPTDGKALENGPGGIHEVGDALAKELERRGFAVTHDETIHLPHDRGAYRRSRRTILEHLDMRPAVVLDIHRDAIPDPNFYADKLNGQGITRVRVVVGRQNPNRAQNLEFAKELKAIADQVHPGYVKQIYNGKNNYNQDLGPRVILFEVGTHVNTRESAQRSMRILAQVLRAYFDRYADDR